MADTRGVFGLKLAGSLKIKGEWVPLDQVWSSPSKATIGAFDTGYFAGGGPSPSAKSTVDKMDFSTESTTYTPSANLNAARNYICGVGNKTSGYTCGGANPSSVSTVEKTSYANDTTANVPGAALSEARNFGGSSGGSNVGYYGGGSAKSIVDKITYSSDTTARIPGADLSGNRSNLTAVGNEGATYFAGGTPGPLTSVEKLLFSTDTTSRIPSADLSVARYEMGGAAGNLTSGYVAGGQPGYTVVDKITYSTDTAARVPGADLVLNNKLSFITTGNRLAGYYAGAGNSPQESRVQKLTYSSESTSSLPSNGYLSSTRGGGGGFSSRENGLGGAPSSPASRFSDGAFETPNAGYFGGGNPGPTSKIDKLSFSTETTANLPGANLSAGRKYMGAAGGTAQGYFAGGHQPPIHSRTDKLTYSTDTAAYTPTANLHIARRDVGGTGNLVAGYFVAGEQPSPGAGQSYVDKCIYATDVTARIPGCNIGSPWPNSTTTDVGKQKQGCGNEDVSFFNGGPGERSFADKITYASDTAATTPSAFLVIGRVLHAAAGNGDAGYFAGGYSQNPAYESRVEKTTYSNDTTTAVPSANLPSTQSGFAGFSNATAAYFGGNPGSTTNKMTFATETTAASPGANMSENRAGFAAVSSRMNGFSGNDPPTPTPSSTIFQEGPNIGYIMGGLDGPGDNRISSTDKLNFSTDTTTLSPSANSTFSSNGVSNGAATHSTSAGYRGGGRVNDGSPNSNVEKLTFSSESIALVPTAGNLSAVRYDFAGTSSPSAGYFGGGKSNPASPSSVSRMDKLTFSSDTTALTPGANLSLQRFGNGAAGNTTHGYFGGGKNSALTPGEYTRMDKLTYSNDTTAAVPGASLTGARYLLDAIGNDTQGYFGGGNPGPNGQITDKLTYASDTIAATPSALVGSGERLQYATTGNIENGYFCGGVQPTQSTTSKLVYSTDTATATPSAFLTAAKRAVVGTSSRMDGAATPHIV